MNILIVGSGGREHALAWKIKQSIHCDELYVAPGNAGTGKIAKNVPIHSEDFKGLANLCHEKNIELVVVGPEKVLVTGIRNFFESNESLKHVALVGPGKEGAQLEGSKDFSKKFMLRNNIPTAKAQAFETNELTEAYSYLDICSTPIVLKADGLAAGKGVVICQSPDEAKSVIREMLVDKKFGEAGNKVLIEEFLDGTELSVFVLTDGHHFVTLPEAKDYKRIGENDIGPNTGGMGAISPVIFASKDWMKKVEEKVIKPTVEGLKKENIPYKGFIFIGLMNVNDEPYVIEYNVRMGDPEAQAILPRIEDDFAELLHATANGKLANKSIRKKNNVAATVVMVAEGYPGNYAKGKVISGLDKKRHSMIFHAGTKDVNGKIQTDGGRVLAITGMGATIKEATENAYRTVANIQWNGLYFRKDIGQDLQNWKNTAS